MTRDLGRMRAAMATLLVASALLFFVGVLMERANGSSGTAHVEATSPPGESATPHVEGSDEAGEVGAGETAESSAPEASAAASGEAGEAAESSETTGNESILGIDPEAPPLVALAIILSLVAAFLVYRDGRSTVVVGAIIIAVGFAALDLLELSHQVREGTALVAVIAAVVAAGHLLAAWFGFMIVRPAAVV
jgi:hypothetical protein